MIGAYKNVFFIRNDLILSLFTNISTQWIILSFKDSEHKKI